MAQPALGTRDYKLRVKLEARNQSGIAVEFFSSILDNWKRELRVVVWLFFRTPK